jgi:predicted ATPase
MRLLEREAPLATLLGALAEAQAGIGSVALVSGEAGIGKTSLVRTFAERVSPPVRLLSTACDDLVTPRTLGPLHEAAAGTDGPLAQALGSDAPADAVCTAVLEEFETPTVMIVEDVHWADDATLDVLGYAARRIAARPALLVLTLRDEAVVPGHPLHRLLGVLAGGPVHRLELEPLSADAVRALADGTGRDPDAVHALTRGNPFFVTEALLAPPDAVPASVKDAVLGRLAQVSGACREAVEQLSVVPSVVPNELAVALLRDRLDALSRPSAQG